MADKFLGISMVLQLNVSSSYTTIGGCVAHTLVINNETIDVSDKDSSRWSDKLAAGARSLDVSFNGWVNDDTTFALIETAAEDHTVLDLKLLYGDSKTVTSNFYVNSFTYTGEYNGSQTFACTLAHDGIPTFA